MALKKKFSLILLQALLFAQLSCAGSPKRVSLPTATNDPSLEAALLEIIQKQNIPSLGAMVIEDGKIIRSAIVGVRKLGDATPVQLNDPYHLGSCTKAMTATLFAMLVEEGKVNWTSTLGELFPEISVNPSYQKVTIEMLLAHRGSLPSDLTTFDQGQLQIKLRDPLLSPSDGRQLVAKALLSVPPKTTPGSTYLYSNADYIITGRVIEKITKKSWEIFITERLFSPLGMKSCGFGAAGNGSATIPDAPWPHYSDSNGLHAIPPGPLADNPATYGPAGSVHCSMEDWGKFLSFHSDGFNHKGSSLLTTASFNKLHQSYPGQEYTYGGWIRTSRVWAQGTTLTHEGSNSLNIADVWIAPLKYRIYLSVTNAGSDSAEKAIQAAILEVISSNK